MKGGLALLTLTAACGGPRESVRVVVVWSGWELTQFRRVLAPFVRGGTGVSVRSAGNDLAALVGDRVARTAAPDVALIQRPTMIDDPRNRFAPLTGLPDVAPGWSRLLRRGTTTYGTWFKAAHKSVVWYRTDRLTDEPPGDWDAWVDLCAKMASAGEPPLSIGAADGWVLTDWFENALRSISPAVYDGLAGGRPLWNEPPVAEALRRIGRLWAIPDVFPGGARRALLTQFDGAMVDVFQHGRGAMVAGADFDFPIIEQFGRYPAGWFRFPAGTLERPPLIVGGDAAVLLNEDSTAGRALIAWLATPDAARIWARAGGFLSLDPEVKSYPGNLSVLARQLQAEGTPAFDLSDQLDGRLTGVDGGGTWKIFQDFFAEVTSHGASLDGAVARAVRALAGPKGAAS